MKLNFTFKGLNTKKEKFKILIREYNLKDAKASFKKLYNFNWKTIIVK